MIAVSYRQIYHDAATHETCTVWWCPVWINLVYQMSLIWSLDGAKSAVVSRFNLYELIITGFLSSNDAISYFSHWAPQFLSIFTGFLCQ